jgi:hypothetical protein
MNKIHEFKAYLDGYNPLLYWFLIAGITWGIIEGWKRVHAKSYEAAFAKHPKLKAFPPLAIAAIFAATTSIAAEDAFFDTLIEALGGGFFAIAINHLRKRAPSMPKPPEGGSFAKLLFPWLPILMLVCVGCSPADSPERFQARTITLTMAQTARTADTRCSLASQQLEAKGLLRESLDLARGCRRAIESTKNALLSAEAGVDAWDAARAGEVWCAMARAVEALTQLRELAAKFFPTESAFFDDALAVVRMGGGFCREST